jgi:hypothetical protein
VIDDEDDTAERYRENFGEQCVQFCKKEVAEWVDAGDCRDDRRAILYARNVSFQIAKDLGFRYFVQLDDDYRYFEYRYGERLQPQIWANVETLDTVFEAFVDFLQTTPTKTIALSQGGDWIGGNKEFRKYMYKRKSMNSFFCDVERPIRFCGSMNEDVTAYVTEGRRGDIFLTTMQVALGQDQTQKGAGGMSDVYLETGTYMKSFYSILYAPSCVKIGTLKDNSSDNIRIHHQINWRATCPKIMRESVRYGEP